MSKIRIVGLKLDLWLVLEIELGLELRYGYG